MKVAISSSSFNAQLAAGDVTQLEWLESCASQLQADGVVFAREHFPRTDGEYVAQLKKIAVEVGLVPVAVSAPQLFDARTSDAERRTTIEMASRLGTLFVIAELPPPGDVPPETFVATVRAAKTAVAAAKDVNITLLATPGPGTLAQDVSELRHFLKDVDSAWLRDALPAGIDRSSMGARDRALLVTVESESDPDVVAEVDEAARPWLLLGGPVDAARILRLRRAAAKKTLAIANVS